MVKAILHNRVTACGAPHIMTIGIGDNREDLAINFDTDEDEIELAISFTEKGN